MYGYIVVEKRAVRTPGQTVAASVSMLRSVVSFQTSWSEVQLVSSHHGQKCNWSPVIMVRSAVGFQCWLQSLWSEVQLVSSVIVVRSTVGLQCYLQSSRSEVLLVSGVMVRSAVGLQSGGYQVVKSGNRGRRRKKEQQLR